MISNIFVVLGIGFGILGLSFLQGSLGEIGVTFLVGGCILKAIRHMETSGAARERQIEILTKVVSGRG